MAVNSKLHEFIERAKTGGASEESLVGILTARGWPEKEVYEALAAHYERVTGVEIPRRGGVGTAAKDAFFYLLVFATLATWTIGLGSVAFTLIDRWLADTLFSTGYNYPGYDTYSIAGALACILVAFPIYLLVSRTVVREGRSDPEKLNSPVRKWLTYMALVIAAGVFIGDLITALTYLLRGEITSRFVAKALVVLLISGGVFFYYFGGLRKTEEASIHRGLSRDAWMAAVSAAGVTLIVVLGFLYIGAPKTQRTLRADRKRVQDLYLLSGQIHTRWSSNGHKLAEHLDELSGVAFADPVTRIAYEYHAKEGSQYELCATFALESRQNNDAVSRTSKWTHRAGRYCFALNAGEAAENPNIYFPD
jgi:hypothetical protein